MAVGKGAITLLEVCNDIDITSGGENMMNTRVQDRCLSVTPNLRAAAGTVTAHHRNIDTNWGATPSHRRKMWVDTYLDPRTKAVTDVGGWQTKIESARNSANDCGVEARMCGRAENGMNLIFEGKIKGFGSDNAKAAPCDIDVIGWQSGYFNGALTILSSVQYYGTFSDRPFSQAFQVPSNRTWLTIIMRQYCFGPNHQPPGSGEAPIGTVYYTLFEKVRVIRQP